jgi:hypothetical protein
MVQGAISTASSRGLPPDQQLIPGSRLPWHRASACGTYTTPTLTLSTLFDMRRLQDALAHHVFGTELCQQHHEWDHW